VDVLEALCSRLEDFYTRLARAGERDDADVRVADEPLADRAAYRAKFSGRNSVAVPPEGNPVDEAERVLYDASR